MNLILKKIALFMAQFHVILKILYLCDVQYKVSGNLSGFFLNSPFML